MSVCAFRSIRKPDLEGTGKTPVSYGEHFDGPIRGQREDFQRAADNVMSAPEVSKRRFRLAPIEIAVALGIIAVLLAILWPAFDQQSRDNGGHSRVRCKNQMKEVLLAILQYHDIHGSFPPAYLADANGKPMHSWRVLILPYVERQDLFDKYRFNEPWDGPNNRNLHSEIVSTFQCPSAQNSTSTSYVAIVGKNTAWPGAATRNLADVRDDPSTTTLVAEVANSGIHWMEPRDLSFEEMSFRVNDETRPSIGSMHSRGPDRSDRVANVGTVNGRALTLTEEVSPDIIEGMLTINGGESIDEESLK